MGILCCGIGTYTNMIFLVECNGLGRHWLMGNSPGLLKHVGCVVRWRQSFRVKVSHSIGDYYIVKSVSLVRLLLLPILDVEGNKR